MPEQTITLIPLPHGPVTTAAAGTVRLSLFVAPRLRDGTNLGDFPDLLAWTRLLAEHGMDLTVTADGVDTRAPVDRTELDPALWAALFAADMPVHPYIFDDHADTFVRSYPVTRALAAVRSAYRQLGAATSPDGARDLTRRRILGDVLAGFADPLPAQTREEVNQRLRAQQWDLQRSGSAFSGLAASSAVSETDAARAVTAQFELFRDVPRPRPGQRYADLPTRAGLAAALDFHAALTALHAHEQVLRWLGLVLRVDLPAGAVPPAAPAPGGTFPTVAVTDVRAGWDWAVPPRWYLPATAYTTAPESGLPAGFAAAPAPRTPESADQRAGTIKGGLLDCAAEGVALTELDVDGSLRKLRAQADGSVLAAADGHEGVGGDTLPALRSAGFSVVVDGRAARLVQAFARNRDLDHACEADQPVVLAAADLVRGWRVDVWTARTGTWRSLHRRTGTYVFGEGASARTRSTADEEGFVQPGATRAAPVEGVAPPPPPAGSGAGDPATDLFVHERLARWDGWSLSVPRPGKALSEAANPDPAAGRPEVIDPSDEPLTAARLRIAHRTVPRTLPGLRFGERYRVRLRVVDLAAHSIPSDAPSDEGTGVPQAPGGAPYLRFEPVVAPVVLLREPLECPGAALTRLVIRSFNADPASDTTPSAETAQRHLAPPRATQRLAEQHGMLDGDGTPGRPRGDAETYAMLAARDGAAFPSSVGAGVGDVSVPVVADAVAEVPYLPDPPARDVVLRDLPGTPPGTHGGPQSDGGDGSLAYLPVDEPDPGPASVVRVPHEGTWPALRGMRLALAEGDSRPMWDAVGRELRTFLPKAAVRTVRVSSGVTDADLELLGVWDWLLTDLMERQNAAIAGGSTDLADELGNLAARRSRLTRLARESGLDLLTPHHELVLVHAVQQPLGSPHFVPGPVVREASGLARGPQPPDGGLTAWRAPGGREAYLFGALAVHGASTARVDLTARWTEFADDLDQDGPRYTERTGPVDQLIIELDGSRVSADGSDRDTGVYDAAQDIVRFQAEGADRAAPVHRFDDTRHRVVHYRATATSRFTEHFPAGLDCTRAGTETAVSVPSSTPPAPPLVTEVVPTFGWERETTTNVRTSVRTGHGVRVYLARPWFSSGEGELLGVLLWDGQQPPDDATRRDEAFTQWAQDPVLTTRRLRAVPRTADFPHAVAVATGVPAPDGGTAAVAGHVVEYDPERARWFADVTLPPMDTYAPFLRLALARYQPDSIPGAELSPAVLADFVQLAPDRTAVVTSPAASPRELRVVVAGRAPDGPLASRVEVTVQRVRPDVPGDLGWEDAPAAVAEVVADLETEPPGTVLWAGTVSVADGVALETLRLVVREWERYERDATGLLELLLEARDGEPLVRERLVYAEFVPVGGPTAGDGVSAQPTPSGPVAEPTPITVPAEPIDHDPLPEAPPPPPFDLTLLPVRGPDADRTHVDGHVKLAQALLNAAGARPPSGAPLVVDGNIGPETTSALRGFRILAFLGTPDDPALPLDAPVWAALMAFAPLAVLGPGPRQPPMTGPPVALLQRTLGLVGTDPGPQVNGVFGPETANAVAAFQSAAGLPASAVADAVTWLALIAGAAAAAQPQGAKAVLFAYDRVALAAEAAGGLVIAGSRALESEPPPSDPTDPLGNAVGVWVEWRAAGGGCLWRRFLHDPFPEHTEVPGSGDGDGGGFSSVPAPQTGRFEVAVPVFAAPARLVVFGTRPGTAGAAVELASFESGQV